MSPTRRRPGRTALALAALALTGCAGAEDRLPLEPPPSGIVAKPLAVGAIEVAYTPTDPQKIWPGRYSPGIDASAVQHRIIALLNERHDAQASGLVEPPALTPHGAPDRVLQDTRTGVARESGAAHLLSITIDDATIKYEGQTKLLVPKIIITVSFFPFDVPNYFMASDKFALTIRAKWKLIDTTGGQVVASGTALGRQASLEGDMSRGWYFVGYLRVPGCLDAGSWKDIADVVVPGAEQAIAEAVVIDVEKALAPD